MVALAYPVGFLVVILGSQQLYTENTLTPIVPLMAKRTADLFGKVLRLWAIVLVSNLVGTLVFAWGVAGTELLDAELRTAVTAVATEGTAMRGGALWARAIAAGWIIALMVWMLPGARHERVLTIVAMAWLVGALGLAHVIVGASESFYLAASGLRGWGEALTGYVFPAVVGNTIGGVVLVALVNHAQVASSPKPRSV